MGARNRPKLIQRWGLENKSLEIRIQHLIAGPWSYYHTINGAWCSVTTWQHNNLITFTKSWTVTTPSPSSSKDPGADGQAGGDGGGGKGGEGGGGEGGEGGGGEGGRGGGDSGGAKAPQPRVAHNGGTKKKSKSRVAEFIIWEASGTRQISSPSDCDPNSTLKIGPKSDTGCNVWGVKVNSKMTAEALASNPCRVAKID